MYNTKLAYSRKQAATELSLSMRIIDHLIAKGDLRTRKIGSRVLIPGRELVSLLDLGTRRKPQAEEPTVQ
jgi:hypothetical protein